MSDRQAKESLVQGITRPVQPVHWSPVADHPSLVVVQLTESVGALQGQEVGLADCGSTMLSPWDDGLGLCHHLAVGADFSGGGLTAGRARVEDGPVFLRHGGCRRLLLALLFKKAPIERLLRAWRLGLQTIQDLLVLEHLGALGHGAFLDDVIDPVQDRIGREFSF